MWPQWYTAKDENGREIVISDTEHTEIKEGPENGCKWWFKDSGRNILLLHMVASILPQNALMDKTDMPLYCQSDLLEYLTKRSIQPEEVMFLSNMFGSLTLAVKNGFHAVEISSPHRKIPAGGFHSCQPKGDSIIRVINYFEIETLSPT